MSLRLALSFLLVLTASTARAGDLPTCEGAKSLRFSPTDVPARVELAMSVELEVEARRLGLVACRGGDAPVEAVVRWGELVHLEVHGANERVVSRELPVPELTDQGVLELALILGDLVHEALAPTVVPAPPVASRWLIGARVAVDGVLVKGTALYGGDVTARYEWHQFGVEFAALGRTSNSISLVQGAVGFAALGGSALVAWRFARPAHTSLAVELGTQVSALQIAVAALASVTATPHQGWLPTADARLGLGLEVPLSKVELSFRFGAAYVLAGVAVQADGGTAVQVAGPALYGSIGVSWRSGGAP